jgi:hypothetical protein
MELVTDHEEWYCNRPHLAYVPGHLVFFPKKENQVSPCINAATQYGLAMVDIGWAKNYLMLCTDKCVHVALVTESETIADFLEFINNRELTI